MIPKTIRLESFSVILTSMILLIGCVKEPEASTQPNIILIFSDDAGYADFSLNGNKKILTPNIDAIAENGVKFTNAYVSAPVCSPSRAGLMTGRYQQRFGHEYNIGENYWNTDPDSIGLMVSEKTIADYLKEQGYYTGLVGKWHLGEREQFHPNNRGFDEFFGMLEGGSAYTSGKAKRILRNYESIDSLSLPYLTDAFGDEAVAFLERNQTKPFFLYLSFNAPHTPMQARSDYLEEKKPLFETEHRAVNAAMTQSLDENVGKVMTQLKALNLDKNTIVIFTNDNGGAMPYNASNNDPFSGTKGTFLEGGIHVPFVMQWPGHIPRGMTFEPSISTMDVLPTAIAAVGGNIPENIDGVDLLPFLVEDVHFEPHNLLFWRLGHHGAVRKANWKLIWFDDLPPRLYDLSIDQSERTDLSSQYPEITATLISDFNSWQEELMKPAWRTDTVWEAHSRNRYDSAFVASLKRN